MAHAIHHPDALAATEPHNVTGMVRLAACQEQAGISALLRR
jgi:hypothetical protein